MTRARPARYSQRALPSPDPLLPGFSTQELESLSRPHLARMQELLLCEVNALAQAILQLDALSERLPGLALSRLAVSERQSELLSRVERIRAEQQRRNSPRLRLVAKGR